MLKYGEQIGEYHKMSIHEEENTKDIEGRNPEARALRISLVRKVGEQILKLMQNED